MNEPQNTSGPQFRADRPREQEAVRTTIVGGRPPGGGKRLGAIPRGIEVLVKKASVDMEFKQLLLDQREAAAETIGLKLDPAEVLMLRAAGAEQLEAVIAQTHIPKKQRRAFLTNAAAVMLAALGVASSGCILGIRPDRPDDPESDDERPEFNATRGMEPDLPPERTSDGDETRATEPAPEPGPTRPEQLPVTDGIRPDFPATKGIRPDRPPAPTGIRPDVPPPAPGSGVE
jgi:hypothetical protein